MSHNKWIVDSANSKLVIRTHATGMLARLAHDLELNAADLRGEATRDDDGFSGQLTVPVASIRVVGVLHGDRVDTSGLSPSDRAEIEKKIRDEVFSGAKEIHVQANGKPWTQANATIEAGHGKVSLPISIRANEADGQLRASGRTEISLSKLGVKEIKGPLGAFKVKDAVEVSFEITLRQAD